MNVNLMHTCFLIYSWFQQFATDLQYQPTDTISLFNCCWYIEDRYTSPVCTFFFYLTDINFKTNISKNLIYEFTFFNSVSTKTISLHYRRYFHHPFDFWYHRAPKCGLFKYGKPLFSCKHLSCKYWVIQEHYSIRLHFSSTW